jgi:hypothetical protein
MCWLHGMWLWRGIYSPPFQFFRACNVWYILFYIEVSLAVFFIDVMCHVTCKQKPATRARINPYPCSRVRVCWGWGTGSPGKPQGYPWWSLIPCGLHVDSTWTPHGLSYKITPILDNLCGVHVESTWTPCRLLWTPHFPNLIPNPNLTQECATARRDTRSLA